MAEPPRRLAAARLASLAGLQLRPRTWTQGVQAGLHRSLSRGFSAEFAEHREYTPGDDLRYLDWKVYGKRDRLYLKQFDAETNCTCHLFVDGSESMAYRSAGVPLSKWDYAAQLATALAWIVLQRQDAVSLTLLDGEVRESLPASTQPAQFDRLMQRLERHAPRATSQLGMLLERQAAQLKRRSVVLLISDLLEDEAPLFRGLQRLAHRGHDVRVLHVIDPAEQDFPFETATEFLGLEQTGSERTHAPSIRAAYRAEFERFLSTTRRRCRELSVDYQPARTDAPAEQVLRRLLSRQGR